MKQFTLKSLVGEADESYVSDVQPDKRKRQRTILDYGDAYFETSLFIRWDMTKSLMKSAIKTKIPYMQWLPTMSFLTLLTVMPIPGMKEVLKAFFIQRLISHLSE